MQIRILVEFIFCDVCIILGELYINFQGEYVNSATNELAAFFACDAVKGKNDTAKMCFVA